MLPFLDAKLAAALAFLYAWQDERETHPMVFLVMAMKAATIATIQFASMADCVQAKKAMDSAMDGIVISVCIDKVVAAPASGG
jgi:hypothetical protein